MFDVDTNPTMRLLHTLCGSIQYFRVTRVVRPKPTDGDRGDAHYYFGFARPLDRDRNDRVETIRRRTRPALHETSTDDTIFFRSVDRLSTLHLGPAICPDLEGDRPPGRGKIVAGVVESTSSGLRLKWWFRDGRCLLGLRASLLRARDPKHLKTIFRAVGERDALYALHRCVRGKVEDVLRADVVHPFRRDQYTHATGFDLHGVPFDLFAAGAAIQASDPSVYAKWSNQFESDRDALLKRYVESGCVSD